MFLDLTTTAVAELRPSNARRQRLTRRQEAHSTSWRGWFALAEQTDWLDKCYHDRQRENE
jgi:hypothetical protein